MARLPIPLGELTPWLLALLLFVTPFSKGAIEVLFTLLLVAWIVEKGIRRNPPQQPPLRPIHRNALWAVAAYTLLCGVTIAYSDFPLLSLNAWFRKTAEYSLLFLIAFDLSSRPGVVERNLQAVRAAAWLVLAYGLFQEIMIRNPWHTSFPYDPIMRRHLYYVRMVGPYENPNDLATFLMVTGLVFWTSRPNRLLALALTLCLIWTKSLGALIGFSAGALFLALQGVRQKRRALGLLAGLALLFAGFLAIEPHIREVFTLSDGASQERLTMWKTGWKMFLDRPWTGHGLNTFMANYQHYAPDPHQAPAYAHNCFLQILAETGVPGLLVFMWIILSLFMAAGAVLFKRVSSAPILSGLMAGLAAYLVQSAFDTNLYALRQAILFWSFAGMGLGFSRLLQTDAGSRPS